MSKPKKKAPAKRAPRAAYPIQEQLTVLQNSVDTLAGVMQSMMVSLDGMSKAVDSMANGLMALSPEAESNGAVTESPDAHAAP